MPTTIQSPRDLAETVYKELSARKLPSPDQTVLSELLEVMFYASLRTEESQPIMFDIVYLDPENPGPKPPQRITYDRWQSVRLKEPIPFTIRNIVKTARASDARTSSLAVYHIDNVLNIWGFIDQGNSYYAMVNHDAESGHTRPGIFQASVRGIGHLTVLVGFEHIADLRVDHIVPQQIDVFRSGPIKRALEPGIETFVASIRSTVAQEAYEERGHWDASLHNYWIASLSRILLRSQNFRHGGAILITPDALAGLNVKYEITYPRLREALERRALHGIQRTFASDEIFEAYIDEHSLDMPVDLYLDETVNADEFDDSIQEVDGAIWFISLLTRVDGLVLMNPLMEVQGFGVEITLSQPPNAVFVAEDARATRDRMRHVDYNYYGTRHRSMMRYCAHIPGSVGFVISQDGDVRVITKVGDRLVIWENIALQNYFKSRIRRRAKRNES